jgi:hypothetical protein
MTTYTVTVTRERKDWPADVEGLPGGRPPTTDAMDTREPDDRIE